MALKPARHLAAVQWAIALRVYLTGSPISARSYPTRAFRSRTLGGTYEKHNWVLAGLSFLLLPQHAEVPLDGAVESSKSALVAERQTVMDATWLRYQIEAEGRWKATLF